MQIASAEEEVDRLTASKASAQTEADEADAAAQQALETGHAEVRVVLPELHQQHPATPNQACGIAMYGREHP